MVETFSTSELIFVLSITVWFFTTVLLRYCCGDGSHWQVFLVGVGVGVSTECSNRSYLLRMAPARVLVFIFSVLGRPSQDEKR